MSATTLSPNSALSLSDQAVIAAVVDNAPPLGASARDRLAVVLSGGGR
ncbi:hypothetical protein [Labedella endophytica]|nr:hypothetical protein [Labedella endophytica]